MRPDLDIRNLLERDRAGRVIYCQATSLRWGLWLASTSVAGPLGAHLAGLGMFDADPQTQAEPSKLVVIRHEQHIDEKESDLTELVQRQALRLHEARGTEDEEKEQERLTHLSRQLLDVKLTQVAEDRDSLGGTPLTDQEATHAIEWREKRWAEMSKNYERYGWTHWGQKYW